jgi:hypothetical protein
MLDLRQSINYAKFLTKQGWIVERINNTNYFIKKLPLIGSVLKIQRPKEIRYKDIEILSKKYKPFQIIIEPLELNKGEELKIKDYGFKLSNSPFLPSKTIHIDLTQSEGDIFRNFSKDCKFSIRKGEGLKIENYNSPEKIKVFRETWRKSVNFKRYVPSLERLLSLKKTFPNNTSIFLTSHNVSGSIIGGAIFTVSSHKEKNFGAYYVYGFTNKEGRTSLSQYSLLYQGILWGKKVGCKIFDMEGIYDDRFPNKSWLGFSHFKKKFGGTEILYPGCYTRYKLPIFDH